MTPVATDDGSVKPRYCPGGASGRGPAKGSGGAAQFHQPVVGRRRRVIGLLVCNGPVLAFTFGVFLKPIMAEMGSQRGAASFALSAGGIGSSLMLPVLARLMDRWGIRAVALPGLVLLASASGALPAIGRFLGGLVFDLAGSYNPALIGAAIVLVLAVVLVNLLGPYRYPARRQVPPALVVQRATP